MRRRYPIPRGSAGLAQGPSSVWRERKRVSGPGSEEEEGSGREDEGYLGRGENKKRPLSPTDGGRSRLALSDV